MKILLSLFLFTSSTNWAFCQQTIIRGVVSIFNSETDKGKKEFVVNAQVKDDSSKATPTLTNHVGEFRLMYVDIPENNTVSFKVNKPLLEVVNIDALSGIAGQKEPIRISMASRKYVADYRARIYHIGKSASEKALIKVLRKRNRELELLKINLKKNTRRILELQGEIYELGKEKDKIERQAQELADRYAPVNLDDASSLFKEAFSLFQSGKLENAQKLLKDVSWASLIDSVVLEEQKVAYLKSDITHREAIIQKRKKDYAEGLELKADFHMTRYEIDSLIVCYEQLLRFDSLNDRYLFRAAYFSGWINQNTKAIYYYKKLLVLNTMRVELKLPLANVDISKIQNNLGILYAEINDTLNAINSYSEALKIKTKLSSFNSFEYKRDLLDLENNIANLQLQLGHPLESENSYIKALDHTEFFKLSDPTYYLLQTAKIQSNLGRLYTDTEEFPKAKRSLAIALKIRESMSNLGDEGAFNLAISQFNFAVLCAKMDSYKDAETSYLKSIEIFKRLKTRVALRYAPFEAMVEHSFGAVLLKTKKFEQSESYLINAFNTRSRLYSYEPERYLKDLSASAELLLRLYTMQVLECGGDYFTTPFAKNFYKLEMSFNSGNLRGQVSSLLVEYYSHCTWFSLLNSKYLNAEEFARKGLNIDSTILLLRANHTITLYFSGKEDQALRNLKHLVESSHSDSRDITDIFLGLLEELQSYGINKKKVSILSSYLLSIRPNALL